MKEVKTYPGKTYAVTSPNGCTVTQHVGEVDIETDVPAGQQTLIIAHTSRFEIDDDSAIVTECGGSAELVFTAATTRAASSGTGSDGMTDEERALLNGAAQRDADNTFTASNTFTGAVDMSGASVTPPEGWEVAELTPEAIQQVVPMAWRAYATAPVATGEKSIAIGDNAKALSWAQAIGLNAKADGAYALAVGTHSEAKDYSNAIGSSATCKNNRSICIGHAFPETIDGVSTWNQCRVQGTGSITIGAGANTLNNGDTESSNSITIGCKAENKGADSVVMGAQAKATAGGSVAIGAGAEAADAGAVVFASHSSDRTMRTQLYFCGAGTPLAVEYYNGEAFMGYTVVDKATGQIAACGTRRMSELFTDNTTAQPATLDEFGDWVMPKVFQPGKGEPQEYTPLPVYPIVEPEMEGMEEV